MLSTIERVASVEPSSTIITSIRLAELRDRRENCFGDKSLTVAHRYDHAGFRRSSRFTAFLEIGRTRPGSGAVSDRYPQRISEQVFE